MQEFFQFVLLGLGAAGVYTLAGQGITVIFRGSGVLNFALGAQALVSAAIFTLLWGEWRWPLAPAFILAVLASTMVGALAHLIVMYPLRNSAPLVRIIATLGILAICQQSVVLAMSGELRKVPTFLPQNTVTILGAKAFADRLIIFGIAVVATIVVAILLTKLKFGLATQAVGENRLAATALGHSPELVAGVNWALGSTFAGVAGVLIVPISGFSVSRLTLIVVPSLAAALIGRFRSLPLTALGALVIGVGQSLLSKYVRTPGWSDALPFLIIVLMMTVSGQVIPRRDEVQARLPRVARTRPRWWAALALIAVGVFISQVGSNALKDTLITTSLAALVGLSLVVLTGVAGQVSLAQFALAGMGGFIAGRLNFSFGWPFPVGIILGTLGAALVGLVFAVPALRVRGATLAVVTLGLALSIEQVVFKNPKFVGGMAGTPVDPASLFGLKVDGINHANRYGVVAVVALALAAWIVSSVRASGVGRRLLAVRSNERAAMALGVNVSRSKFYAFGLAAAIAGLGGVLMAFRYPSIQYGQFGPFSSINLVSLALIGGVGFVAGAVLGAAMVPAGVINYLVSGIGNLEHWLLVASGVFLILTLISNPDGVAGDVVKRLARFRRKSPKRSRSVPWSRPDAETLFVDGLTVKYGPTTAVDDLSFEIAPGTILGLIGPNGAGKTSAIDAISGFARAEVRTMRLGSTDLRRMSPHRRAQGGVQRCFQAVELFSDMTVRENLLTAAERLPWSTWITSLGWSRLEEVPDEVLRVMEGLGLADSLDQFPDELPHGKRRLVGVLRALAARPRVLMLDEPAAGLDVAESLELGNVLRRIATEWGVGILLVEHDVGLVARVCDEVVALNFGKTIGRGAPEEVLAGALVRQAYLGVSDVEAPS